MAAVELNDLLVSFGKHVCTGWLPKCSTCPCWTGAGKWAWERTANRAGSLPR